MWGKFCAALGVCVVFALYQICVCVNLFHIPSTSIEIEREEGL